MLSATNDDRVKDRLGGWQDSETRKSIYQDRETDELRAQAASLRRQLRIGRGLTVSVNSEAPATQSASNHSSPAPESSSHAASIDELWESLSPAQRKLLRARLNA